MSYGQQLQRQQKSLDAHEAELKRLSAIVYELLFEMRRTRDEWQHFKETDAKDKELILLRMENELLKWERRLPPRDND